MTTFAIMTAVASLVIFAGWLALCIRKFGWLKSYSAYSTKWDEGGQGGLWTFATVISALLFVPAMLEAGDESPLQFLGFFAPVYLNVVAFTPKWESDRKQKLIHNIGSVVCVVCIVLWLVYALRLWYYIPIAIALAAIAAYCTRTWEESYTLWLELAMFAAAYGAVLIGG